MNVIRSRKHEIFSETVNKITLSANDDKRIIQKDGISTFAWGHILKSEISTAVFQVLWGIFWGIFWGVFLLGLDGMFGLQIFSPRKILGFFSPRDI